MINDLRGLAIFVAVADAKSFSRAGRHLKLSTSVISHHVSRLEAKLGMALFFRSTRSISLTREGQMMLPAARRMVVAGEEALEAVAAIGTELTGSIRLTMPAFGENTALNQAVWAFVRKHPKVMFSIHKSDVTVDLVKDGYDIAIRLGKIADQSLTVRKIGAFDRLLVASPNYLNQKDPVLTPNDLETLDFISYTMIPDGFTLLSGEQKVAFKPKRKSVEVNSVASAKAAILAGLGVQRLAASEVEPLVADGRLVRILPEWSLPIQGIYAAWSSNGPQKHAAKELVDFLAENIRTDGSDRV